jgi:hypothetical protein
LLAGGAAVALLAGFLGGWSARGWKADSDQFSAMIRADVLVDEARAQGLAQGKDYAQFAAANAEQARSDHNTIRETFREIHVPADCAAPAAVVGVLEDSVRHANSAAAGEPGPTLPEPAASAGPAQ